MDRPSLPAELHFCRAARLTGPRLLAALVATLLWTAPVSAIPLFFEIDSSLSSISITGIADLTSLGLGPVPLDPQGTLVPAPGYAGLPLTSDGDVAIYTGLLKADVTAGSIELLSLPAALQATAAPSGIWAPELGGGPPGATLATLTYDPAAYGHSLIGGVIVTAIRDVSFDITSGVLPLAGGSFPAAGASADWSSGLLALTDTTGANAIADPAQVDLGPAVPPIPNFLAGPGSLSGTSLGDTLVVPIDFAFTLPVGTVPVDLTISGTLVAHVVPEPTNVLLFATGLAGLAWRVRRR